VRACVRVHIRACICREDNVRVMGGLDKSELGRPKKHGASSHTMCVQYSAFISSIQCGTDHATISSAACLPACLPACLCPVLSPILR